MINEAPCFNTKSIWGGNIFEKCFSGFFDTRIHKSRYNCTTIKTVQCIMNGGGGDKKDFLCVKREGSEKLFAECNPINILSFILEEREKKALKRNTQR